jgi:hypothetical protein
MDQELPSSVEKTCLPSEWVLTAKITEELRLPCWGGFDLTEAVGILVVAVILGLVLNQVILGSVDVARITLIHSSEALTSILQLSSATLEAS